MGVFLGSARAVITTPPSDTTVKFGEDAVLQCISDDVDDLIEWRDNDEAQIWDRINGISNPSKYEIVGTGTDYTLKIEDCRWGLGIPDGGRYSCSRFGAESETAQVVVMGKVYRIHVYVYQVRNFEWKDFETEGSTSLYILHFPCRQPICTSTNGQ